MSSNGFGRSSSVSHPENPALGLQAGSSNSTQDSFRATRHAHQKAPSPLVTTPTVTHPQPQTLKANPNACAQGPIGIMITNLREVVVRADDGAHGPDGLHNAGDDDLPVRGLQCDPVAHHKGPGDELQSQRPQPASFVCGCALN